MTDNTDTTADDRTLYEILVDERTKLRRTGVLHKVIPQGNILAYGYHQVPAGILTELALLEESDPLPFSHLITMQQEKDVVGHKGYQAYIQLDPRLSNAELAAELHSCERKIREQFQRIARGKWLLYTEKWTYHIDHPEHLSYRMTFGLQFRLMDETGSHMLNGKDYLFAVENKRFHRYWLFGGSQYYPNGGLHDLKLTRPLLTDLRNMILDPYLHVDDPTYPESSEHLSELDWWYVFDSEEHNIPLYKKCGFLEDINRLLGKIPVLDGAALDMDLEMEKEEED